MDCLHSQEKPTVSGSVKQEEQLDETVVSRNTKCNGTENQTNPAMCNPPESGSCPKHTVLSESSAYFI